MVELHRPGRDFPATEDETQNIPAVGKEMKVTDNRVLQGKISEGDPDEVYNRLVIAGKDVLNATGWMLGDLATKVETNYGEGRLGKYAFDIGTSYKTVLNARTVARAWPESSRRPELSFGVAATLAAQSDRVDLIQQFPEMTVSQARQIIRDRRQPEGIESPSPVLELDHETAVKTARKLIKQVETVPGASPDEIADLLDRAANRLRRKAKAIES